MKVESVARQSFVPVRVVAETAAELQLLHRGFALAADASEFGSSEEAFYEGARDAVRQAMDERHIKVSY